MYKQLKPKGFNLVAVNAGDPAATIKKYLKENKFTFPTVMSGFDKGSLSDMYKVQAYPSNYVISPAGKVVFSCVGFDEKGIRKALASLGVK
jgi:hypothetical protein